jgi:tRNA modification GTPase
VEDGFEPAVPDSWRDLPRIKISALYGTGLNELKGLIVNLSVGEYGLEAKNTIIPNIRHKIALERCLELCATAIEAIRKEISFEFIAIDIQEAIDRLGEIIGDTVKEDVIDQIFSRFCIGK